jgi:hypothetical protein
MCGNDEVSQAMDQVERVLAGESPADVGGDGPLLEGALSVIVAAHQQGGQ